MSGFQGADKGTKLGELEPGYRFIHEYDYGSTTETLITVIGRIKRPAQKGIVRLLSRNVPPEFTCVECGAPAEFICTECQYDSDNPFYCAGCAEAQGQVSIRQGSGKSKSRARGRDKAPLPGGALRPGI